MKNTFFIVFASNKFWFACNWNVKDIHQQFSITAVQRRVTIRNREISARKTLRFSCARNYSRALLCRIFSHSCGMRNDNFLFVWEESRGSRNSRSLHLFNNIHWIKLLLNHESWIKWINWISVLNHESWIMNQGFVNHESVGPISWIKEVPKLNQGSICHFDNSVLNWQFEVWVCFSKH